MITSVFIGLKANQIMDYTDFTKTLSRYQTENIKISSVNNIYYLDQFPKAILPLFKEIINILQYNSTITQPKEKIYLLGIQVIPFSIESEIPLLFKRIFNPKFPKRHFCCSLQYSKELNKNPSSQHQFKNIQSISIDFTSGEIGDSNYYLSKIVPQKYKGQLYGRITSKALDRVWSTIHQKFI
jgi:hypothetical protein